MTKFFLPFRSLRARMITMAAAALALAVLVYFGLNAAVGWGVQRWYLTEESIERRNDEKAELLRDFLAQEPVSASNSAALQRWAEEDGQVYAVIFLPDFVYEVNWWGTQVLQRTTDLEWELKHEGYSFYTIAFEDGAHLVAVMEDSELQVYNLGNYIALGAGFAVIVAFFLIYSRWLQRRIALLSQEVNAVSHGDLNHEIVPLYRDEISSLARDVEVMRTTIIQRGFAEQSALQANSDLITALSHDIRNPLTALIGYLELLDMDRASLSETDREYLRASLEKSYRIRDLTGELFRYFLVFGKASQGVELEEYDAEMFLWQLLGECSEDLISKGFQLENEAIETERALRTDVGLIRRVVDNLVSNIVKYADPAEPVRIAARIEGEEIVVTFSNRIAAPRLDAVESNHIGLRTCEAILKLLEGRFTSRTEGSTFTAEFTIPLAK